MSDHFVDASNMVCGNCSHYRPYRDPQTDRVHPSKRGQCGWRPALKWPMAFRRTNVSYREEDPVFFPASVRHYTDARTCACFASKAPKPMKPETETELI